MSWFGNLQIRSKFNLIMSALLICLFLAAAFLTYQKQQALILKVAVDNARNFARQIIETRNYMSEAVKDEPEQNYALVPQVVATQVAKRTTRESGYYVRQVSLRYRNPENSPDNYEAVQLKVFTTGKTAEISSVETVKGEQTFRFLQPMIAVESCLSCHGDYDKAPQFVRTRFPRGHYSYNYQLGEVIGAVSVSIPMAELYREIGANFKLDLMYRGGIFFVIILVMGMVIRRSIIDPVKMLSETITRVTRTGNFSEQLPKRTNDEIGTLIGAFNDMMEELARKTAQSAEAESRYRSFIEMARSAVVTCLRDGKIIIANQKAAELLGRSPKELLGKSLFDFLSDNSAREDLFATYQEGKNQRLVTESSLQTVRGSSGKMTSVEMVVSASENDQQPLFTAILREVGEPGGAGRGKSLPRDEIASGEVN